MLAIPLEQHPRLRTRVSRQVCCPLRPAPRPSSPVETAPLPAPPADEAPEEHGNPGAPSEHMDRWVVGRGGWPLLFSFCLLLSELLGRAGAAQWAAGGWTERAQCMRAIAAAAAAGTHCCPSPISRSLIAPRCGTDEAEALAAAQQRFPGRPVKLVQVRGLAWPRLWVVPAGRIASLTSVCRGMHQNAPHTTCRMQCMAPSAARGVSGPQQHPTTGVAGTSRPRDRPRRAGCHTRPQP